MVNKIRRPGRLHRYFWEVLLALGINYSGLSEEVSIAYVYELPYDAER